MKNVLCKERNKIPIFFFFKCLPYEISLFKAEVSSFWLQLLMLKNKERKIKRKKRGKKFNVMTKYAAEYVLNYNQMN